MNKREKINLFDAVGNKLGETDNAVLVGLLQAINKATRPLSESLRGPTPDDETQIRALLHCRHEIGRAFDEAILALGKWLRHDGGPCPIDDEQECFVLYRMGDIAGPDVAGEFEWQAELPRDRVKMYCIVNNKKSDPEG